MTEVISKPFTRSDMTPIRIKYAETYCKVFGPDNEDKDIKAWSVFNTLSTYQALHILNTIWKIKNPRDPKKQPLDGSYYIEWSPKGATNRLQRVTIKVKTQRPAARFKAAETLLYYYSEHYHSDMLLGTITNGDLHFDMQYESSAMRPEFETAIEVILKDPARYSKSYGLRTGKCGVCGRHLINSVSVTRGIGPICYDKIRGLC